MNASKFVSQTTTGYISKKKINQQILSKLTKHSTHIFMYSHFHVIKDSVNFHRRPHFTKLPNRKKFEWGTNRSNVNFTESELITSFFCWASFGAYRLNEIGPCTPISRSSNFEPSYDSLNVSPVVYYLLLRMSNNSNIRYWQWYPIYDSEGIHTVSGQHIVNIPEADILSKTTP